MNTERSIKLIRERFAPCTETAPNLYRAELRYGDRPRSIYYFDFSESVADEGFKITDYLQKYVAPDFYQNEGSLQWNFYLYFVVGKPKLKVIEDSGLAHNIELDRTFARKYVRDEDWFLQELSGSASAVLFKEGKPKDIASHWVEMLNDAGLGKIADLNTPYTTIIDDFMKGRSGTKAPTVLQQKTVKIADGTFLETLEIDSFRKHPLKKRYEFGTVNLIRGVNGSGKTSLLEAIELGICGGIRRQDGRATPKAALNLKFTGLAQPTKAPLTDPTHYRNMDAAWYGGYYRKVNKLCENFGRFNFFDADAGFRLSHGESAEAIREAIEALFLGEYANSLETIMERCKGGFEVKQREFRQRLASLVVEEAKIESDLATVRKIKNTTDTLLAELKAKCKLVGWVQLPTKLKQSELVATEESIEELRAHLSNSLRQVRWLSKLTIETLTENSAHLKLTLKDFTSKQEDIAIAERKLQQFDEDIPTISAKLLVVERLTAYFSDEEATKLQGIHEIIATKKAEYDTLREVNTLMKDVDVSGFANIQGSLGAALEQLEASTTAKKRSLSQKRKTIEIVKKQSGEILALVEEIKGMGKHLCAQAPGLKDCPVCGVTHEGGLLERINKFKPDKSVDNSLRQLTTDAATEEKELANFQNEKGNLEQIQRAALRVLTESQISTRSLKNILALLAGNADRATKVKSEFDALTALEKRARTRGFSQAEFSSLLEEAEEIYEIPRAQLSKASSLSNLLEKDKKALENWKKQHKETSATLKVSRTQINSLVKQALGVSEFDDPSVEIERRMAEIQNATQFSRLAKDCLTFLPDAEFSALRDQLKLLCEAFTRTREAQKQIEEKDALEKKWVEMLVTAKSSGELFKARSKRVAEALTVLNQLLNSENKNAYLSSMLKEQKEKLASFFRQIHSPQEFDQVQLNGNIFLSRRDGGLSNLTEISTGQRSALALSIFLSMNSSVGKKAPWLIFDDPIVHIDDLNVLSFLDALRELVITGERQMFFATASSKVANLFARKFDFLGNAFKEFVLERPEL